MRKEQNRVPDKKEEEAVVPGLDLAPHEVVPPDGEVVVKDVDGPDGVDPVRLDRRALLDRFAKPQEDVSHTEAQHDRNKDGNELELAQS